MLETSNKIMGDEDFPPMTVGKLMDRLQDMDHTLPVKMVIEIYREPDKFTVYRHTANIRHIFTVGGATHMISVELEGRAGV